MVNPDQRAGDRPRIRERFCEFRNSFGNRCNAPIRHDLAPFCRWHYPSVNELTAKDVGPPLEQCVYFVLAAENEVVKIGTTRNLTKRLRALNHASPTPLILLGSVEGATQVERWFHQQCIKARSHLEWFHWVPEVCSLVDRALRLGDGAAREMCPGAYQTDRSGRDFSDIDQLPNLGSRAATRERYRGKMCCGHTCPLHRKGAE